MSTRQHAVAASTLASLALIAAISLRPPQPTHPPASGSLGPA